MIMRVEAECTECHWVWRYDGHDADESDLLRSLTRRQARDVRQRICPECGQSCLEITVYDAWATA